MSARILIVDDDNGYASALARYFSRAGHEVTTLGSAAQARSQVQALAPDVVVLDQRLPDASGLDFLEELKPMVRDGVFVVVTAYPDVDTAVSSMRRGAFDYLGKGIDLRECGVRLERAVDHAQLRRRVSEAQSTQTERAESLLIGESVAMERLRARLRALAASDDTTALILGETGVGKGLVARAVHMLSGRVAEPFVAVDCTTIPQTLVESELFGHEKGAFSGATALKPGRVESAGRGTLFLDEIGELELPVQAKLLRLLEEREYTRVGGTTPRKLQARIITATNRDLPRAVEEGRFRADLRYRLEVFVLEVPPLRERGEDVILLADHYAGESARALGRTAPVFTRDVRDALRTYPFPGNVRELRNMVEQAMRLVAGDDLTLDEFPVLAKFQGGWQPPTATHHRLSARPPPPAAMGSTPAPRASFVAAHSAPPVSMRVSGAPPSLGLIRERYAENERAKLVDALEASGGNVSRAARQVGLSRYQLLRRLAKYGLR
jgi:two-component system, NtrC family, response regulator AtoC